MSANQTWLSQQICWARLLNNALSPPWSTYQNWLWPKSICNKRLLFTINT